MLKLVGKYVSIFALLFFLPIIVDCFYYFSSAGSKQPYATLSFLISFAICLAIGLLCIALGKERKINLFQRDMIFFVILMWVMTTLMGAMPFLFSKTFNRFEDAWFESVSAVTTTGVTVIYPKSYAAKLGLEKAHTFRVPGAGISPGSDKEYAFYGNVQPIVDSRGKVLYSGIDALPRSIVFWRNLLQWIGALGIVCLFVALFPLLGIGMRNVFQIELPGVLQSGVAPRIKETFIRLLKVYALISLFEIVLLKLTNWSLPIYDAICLTFSTISTGGLGVHSGGIPAYNNLFTEWVLCFFMVLSGINFALYYFIIQGKLYYVRNAELRTYLILLASAGIFLTLTLVGRSLPTFTSSVDRVFSITNALRYGVFQAVAAMTGTGFVTSSYTLWPMTSQLILLFLPFIGGMVGSTTGGIKVSRHILLFSSTIRRIRLFFKPDVVMPMKIGRVRVKDDYLQDIFALFWLVIVITIGATFVFVAEGFPASFSLGIITAMLTNSGMPFSGLPTAEHDMIGSLAFLPKHLKLLCIGLMFLGRLEYFVLLILFVPAFWRRG